VLISVAICTWNRAGLLERTLSNLHALHIPAGVDWEVVVVNNNSTDATGEVLARHSVTLPLRILFEPKQGLSRARNAAVAAARGDYVIFADDDILVDPEWLAAYVDVFRRRPDAAYFGGVITPHYPEPPPAWVSRYWYLIQGVFAALDYGPEERPFGPSESPYCASMAVRADLLRRHLFDDCLGRRGEELLAGEETALVERLRAEGWQGFWVPAAKVQHLIRPERLKVEFVCRHFHGRGRTAVRLARLTGRPFRPSLWWCRVLAQVLPVKMAWERLWHGEPTVHSLALQSMAWGCLEEAHKPVASGRGGSS
jgi:glycosyltransferase involved in cell wall biosynthesis